MQDEGKKAEARGTAAGSIRIRRALLSVSDKSGVVELACALARAGAEIVATGKTAKVLAESGLEVTPIERISGSPEAFQGRMKTLSFPVCGGILYRRDDPSDQADLQRLAIPPIDCVVVNFYPFEAAARKPGISRRELIEEVDVGGPTLVRAAAKNAPDVLVLTDPRQYARVISELERSSEVSAETALGCAAQAWDRVLEYDSAIAETLGGGDAGRERRRLRYGENPHQSAELEYDSGGPIDWSTRLSPTELSYNNILDLSSAYALAGDLIEIDSACTGVVIVKHNNPCGVAMVPANRPHAQLEALQRAWEGDPVSAYGGVLIFTGPLEDETGAWLADRFVELVAAPGLEGSSALQALLARRRNLKAVAIRRFGAPPERVTVVVPGGRLHQTSDRGTEETLRSMTRASWPETKLRLGRFGIAVCRALKSNAIALVREVPGISGAFQLAGAGQGQPNRVDALRILAVPRARILTPDLSECVMVSDAFFPFRDTVDAAAEAGIRCILQPGGSVRDADSIAACDEHGIAMAFTGVRHFKH